MENKDVLQIIEKYKDLDIAGVRESFNNNYQEAMRVITISGADVEAVKLLDIGMKAQLKMELSILDILEELVK